MTQMMTPHRWLDRWPGLGWNQEAWAVVVPVVAALTLWIGLHPGWWEPLLLLFTSALVTALLPRLLIAPLDRVLSPLVLRWWPTSEPVDRLLPHLGPELATLADEGVVLHPEEKRALIVWLTVGLAIAVLGGVSGGLVSLLLVGSGWVALESAIAGVWSAVFVWSAAILTSIVWCSLLILWTDLFRLLLGAGRFKLAGGIAAQAFLVAVLTARYPGSESQSWVISARCAAFLCGGIGAWFGTRRLAIFDPESPPEHSRPTRTTLVLTLAGWGILVGSVLVVLLMPVGLWFLPGPAQLAGHENAVTVVAAAGNGRLAASGSEDRMIRLWDLVRRREVGILQGHNGTVLSLDFSPDGTRLVSTSTDQSIRIWNVEQQKLLRRWPGRAGVDVLAVIYSRNGEQVLSADRAGVIRLLDVRTGRVERQFDLSEEAGWSRTPTRLALSPSGKLLAVGTVEGELLVVDLAQGKVTGSRRGCQGGVVGLSFRGEDEVLAAGKESGLVAWSLGHDEEVGRWSMDGIAIGCVAFAPEGLRALVLRSDESGCVVPLRGWMRRNWSVAGRCATWTHDGRMLLTGNGNHVGLWPMRE